MTHTPPRLPDTGFPPLKAEKLEAMIDFALAHPQQGAQPARRGNIIAFPRRMVHNLAFGSGMAAMAASVMLAFMLTPQTTLTTTAALTVTEAPTSADVTDMLLYESLGA